MLDIYVYSIGREERAREREEKDCFESQRKLNNHSILVKMYSIYN